MIIIMKPVSIVARLHARWSSRSFHRGKYVQKSMNAIGPTTGTTIGIWIGMFDHLFSRCGS